MKRLHDADRMQQNFKEDEAGKRTGYTDLTRKCTAQKAPAQFSGRMRRSQQEMHGLLLTAVSDSRLQNLSSVPRPFL